MNRFKKTLDNQRGGLSLEAAIVLPIIIVAFFVVTVLMHMHYTHAKIQLNLNRICNEYMYDSYFLEEAGVFDALQKFTGQNQDFLSLDEIRDLMKMEVPLSEKVEGLSFDTFQGFFDTSSNLLETWVELSDVYRKVSATAKSEGGYLIGNVIGRLYFQEKLNEISEELGIDDGIQIEHLDSFSHDSNGLIIINYTYDMPFSFIGSGKVRFQNSCSLQSFSGCYDLNIKYHKAVETSTYGKGNGQSEVDEDGYLRKVYVTPDGKRYHKFRDCYHISVDYHMILPQSVGDRKLCSKCAHSGQTSTFGFYYITDGSNVYHTSNKCSALEHDIEVISEKEAISRGLTECKTCLNRSLSD